MSALPSNCFFISMRSFVKMSLDRTKKQNISYHVSHKGNSKAPTDILWIKNFNSCTVDETQNFIGPERGWKISLSARIHGQSSICFKLQMDNSASSEAQKERKEVLKDSLHIKKYHF